MVLDVIPRRRGRGVSRGARFFPEVKANIFGLEGLPPVTRDALFVLVLIVAGVTAQALWWMIRTRQIKN